VSRALVLTGPHGRIEVAGDALDAIVAGALAGVDGVTPARGRKALHVEAETGSTTVEAHLTLAEGLTVPDAAEAAQRAVAETLAAALGAPARVDVVIAGFDA
jgi:uncharacterized alkaline shock family protein YloU